LQALLTGEIAHRVGKPSPQLDANKLKGMAYVPQDNILRYHVSRGEKMGRESADMVKIAPRLGIDKGAGAGFITSGRGYASAKRTDSSRRHRHRIKIGRNRPTLQGSNPN